MKWIQKFAPLSAFVQVCSTPITPASIENLSSILHNNFQQWFSKHMLFTWTAFKGHSSGILEQYPCFKIEHGWITFHVLYYVLLPKFWCPLPSKHNLRCLSLRLFWVVEVLLNGTISLISLPDSIAHKSRFSEWNQPANVAGMLSMNSDTASNA